MATFEFDEEVLQGFIAEAQEDLASIEQVILQLEDAPTDTELLNAIFRPIHSIKGNSAFFNLNALKQLTHEFENLLDALRRGRLPVLPETISILFHGTDLTRQAIDRAGAGEFAVDLTPKEAEFLQQLAAAQRAPAPETQLRDVRAGLQQLADRIQSGELSDVVAVSTAIEAIVSGVIVSAEPTGEAGPRSPADGLLEAIRTYITGTAEAPPMAQNAWEAFCRTTAALRDMLGDALADVPELRDALDGLITDVQAVVDSPLEPDELVTSIFTERLDTLQDLVRAHAPETADAAEADAIPASTAPQPGAAPGPEPAAQSERTMRISEAAVDEFMNFVGDLIMTGEVFHYLEKRLANERIDRRLLVDFQTANQGFDELSAQLRNSLMNVRKLPLRQVLQKVPRTVRDLAKKVNKQVEVVIAGDKLQADKRIIEKLEAPVMHAVRNCVDHGLEQPEARRAAGKPETGRVEVTVTEEADALMVRITDDGAGLDPAKLRAVAVSKGVISEAAAADLSDAEAVQLIFAPGFSTAEVVTDVSGRGVGMDVVRTNLAEIGGEVHVESTLGQGTTVMFTLPLSSALIVVNCLVARLGDEQYLVPAEFVRRAVSGHEGQLVEAAAQGEVFRCPDGLYALIRLAELLGTGNRHAALGTGNGRAALDTGTVLLLDHEQRTGALLVDEVLSLQPVVVKELTGLLSSSEAFMGTALMGDGRITLVLNVPNIINFAVHQAGEESVQAHAVEGGAPAHA